MPNVTSTNRKEPLLLPEGRNLVRLLPISERGP